MDTSKLSPDDIEFIDELVRRSGKLAMQMREGVGVHSKSGPHDLVTDADLAISRVIVEALSQRFKDDLIVSEEDKHEVGVLEGNCPPRVWLIDPIDGTKNYVDQDGQYTSMIGLLIDGQPYYGWIYQPTTQTLFSGGPGYGAWKKVGTTAAQRYPLLEPLSSRSSVRLMMNWTDRKRHPWILQLPGTQLVPSDSLGLKIVKILDNEADMFLSLVGRVKLWDTAAPTALALGNALDVGTAQGERLDFPVPAIQHASSVIIGRPGSVAWVVENAAGRATTSVPK